MTWEQRWEQDQRSRRNHLHKKQTKQAWVSEATYQKHTPSPFFLRQRSGTLTRVPNLGLCGGKLNQAALFDSINLKKPQREFSHSTEMQLFGETAKGRCTALQKVSHNLQAGDLPLTHNSTKPTCHQVLSCYLLKGKWGRGRSWGILVSRRQWPRDQRVEDTGSGFMSK